MISSLKNDQLSLEKTIKSVTDQVSNNTNILNSLEDRFDYECVTLTLEFLQKMKNDKLVFYFKKSFSNKPVVLITIKSMTLAQPDLGGDKHDVFKFRDTVKDENVGLKSFKFSIEHKSDNNPLKQVKLDTAEVCYLAFEELKVPSNE